jgi:hypothetical protein
MYYPYTESILFIFWIYVGFPITEIYKGLNCYYFKIISSISKHEKPAPYMSKFLFWKSFNLFNLKKCECI